MGAIRELNDPPERTAQESQGFSTITLCIESADYKYLEKIPLISDGVGSKEQEEDRRREKQETKRTFCSSWRCVQTEAASFIKNLLQAVN